MHTELFFSPVEMHVSTHLGILQKGGGAISMHIVIFQDVYIFHTMTGPSCLEDSVVQPMMNIP